MSSAIALLLLQVPLTAEQIHAEDAKVIETTLLGYWAKARPVSDTLYVPSLTSGPTAWGDPIVDEGYDVAGDRVGKVAFDSSLRESLTARNAHRVSLAWLRPRTSKIQLVDPKAVKIFDGRRLPHRQYSWLHMPGYSKDRTRAIVCFGFNWSIHSGRATVWLTKTDGVWKITDVRDVRFV